jgi:hypothetical protein
MSQDDRTPIELLDQFCQQTEHHWNTEDYIEYIRPVRETLEQIDQLTTERNELRAQVAMLRNGIEQAYRTENHHKIYEILGNLKRQTPADAAQYVRGLEAALQQILEIDDIVDGYSYDPAPHVIKHTPVEMWRIAFNALARKERS